MYIFERLFGVGIYCFALFLCYFLLLKSNLSYKTVLRAYVLVLSVMGFCYVPPQTADLYSIYGFTEYYATFSFLDFYEVYVQGSSIPVAKLYYWLIGKIGEPRLLPAITCLFTYSCVFYIVRKTAKRYHMSRASIANAVLLLMAVDSYVMVISNIRTMLAVAVFALCFFRETVEKKFKVWHLVAYALSALLHNIALILVVLRFILFVLTSSKNVLTKLAMLAVTALILLTFVMCFDSAMSDFMGTVIYYLTEDTYSYKWEYMSAVITLIGLLCILNRFKRTERMYLPEFSQLFVMTRIFCLFACVFCFVFSIFYRFIVLIAPIISVPLLMVGLESTRAGAGKMKNSAFQNRMQIICIFLLFLNCARGSLCSLKFFVL